MPDISGLDSIATKMEMLHEDVGEMKAVLRDLTQAITKLALVEERQTQFAAAQERLFKALGKVEDRVAAIEQALPSVSRSTRLVENAIVALATVALLFVAHKVGLM